VFDVPDGVDAVFPLVFRAIVVVGPDVPVALIVDVLAPLIAQACISVGVYDIVFFVNVSLKVFWVVAIFFRDLICCEFNRSETHLYGVQCRNACFPVCVDETDGVAVSTGVVTERDLSKHHIVAWSVVGVFGKLCSPCLDSVIICRFKELERGRLDIEVTFGNFNFGCSVSEVTRGGGNVLQRVGVVNILRLIFVVVLGLDLSSDRQK